MEKYTVLSQFNETIYSKNVPFVIYAKAIIKNNESGKVFAQIMFKNISEKKIRAIKFSIKAFDTFGTEVEGIPEYAFIDFAAGKNEIFGEKNLIPLPNVFTRFMDVKCSEIVFFDGSSMQISNNEIWNEFPKQSLLEEKLGKELADQYRRDTFAKAKYVPDTYEDIWRCTCGAINKNEGKFCSACGSGFEKTTAALDEKVLSEHLEVLKRAEAEKAEAIRLEYERRKAEEERKRLEEKRRIAELKEQKKKRIKRIVTVLILLLVLVLICISAPFAAKAAAPMIKYNKAVKYMEEGEYSDAIELFLELEDYKDSEAQLKICIASKFSDLKKGDTFELGDYYGKIEWIVLERENGKIFAITKYCIDCKEFNNVNTKTNWKECSLNKWLNSEFINMTFNTYEQSILINNSRKEKVSILSTDEVNKYLPEMSERKTLPSEHAKENGICMGYEEYAWWWLRTNGRSAIEICYVSPKGEIDTIGRAAYEPYYGIRPAILIDVSETE